MRHHLTASWRAMTATVVIVSMVAAGFLYGMSDALSQPTPPPDSTRTAGSAPPEPPMPRAKSPIETEKAIEGGLHILPESAVPERAGDSIATETAAPPEDVQAQSPPVDEVLTENGQSGETGESASGTPGQAAGGAASGAAAAGAAVGNAAGAAAGSAAGAVTAEPSPSQPAQQATQQQPPAQQQPRQLPETFRLMEELSLFNVPTANLRTVRVVIDDGYNLRGMVYGEEAGFIRILEADEDGNFRETWKSPSLSAAVRGVFVEDVQGDGSPEIVAYTTAGNIFIYDYESHDLVYRTPEGTYSDISCMAIENMDRDDQLELFFVAGSRSESGDFNGHLVQFDCRTMFEEWRSSETYAATDIIIGNVDTDDELEIILNSGEVMSYQFKNVEWKSDVDFGDRLYLIDVDDDGVLELVTEYQQRYVRVFDIDQRREKW